MACYLMLTPSTAIKICGIRSTPFSPPLPPIKPTILPNISNSLDNAPSHQSNPSPNHFCKDVDQSISNQRNNRTQPRRNSIPCFQCQRDDERNTRHLLHFLISGCINRRFADAPPRQHKQGIRALKNILGFSNIAL